MENPTAAARLAAPIDAPAPEPALEPGQEHRHRLRTQHSKRLTELLDERSDLRGVHALADLVSDSVRWSA